jgi:DNA-directed RNA polymerase subunit omega
VRNNAKYMCVRRMSLLQAVFFMVESAAITIAKLRAPYAPKPPSQPKNAQNTDAAKLWNAMVTCNPQDSDRFGLKKLSLHWLGGFATLLGSFGEKRIILKAELSEKALKLVGNPNVLVNLISRRVRQLNSGGNKPLILETAGLSTADIALTEIIEGKMKWETDLPKPKRKSRRRVRKA